MHGNPKLLFAEVSRVPVVTILPSGRRIEIEPGRTLLEAARQLSFSGEPSVELPCGGKGLCGRCRVMVLEGELAPPTPNEERLLSAGDLESGRRLACQARPLGSVNLEIPPESMTGEPNLQLEAGTAEVTPEPLVRRYLFHLEKTTLDHPVSAWDQAIAALGTEYGLAGAFVDPEVIRHGAPVVSGGPAEVSVRASEIIRLHTHLPAPPSLGLAVDLGSTKIAAYLVDLKTGDILDAEGMLNPQIRFGEDVISRIAYASENVEQADTIRRITVDGLNHLADILAGRKGLNRSDIEHAAIVGNTAMHHLLLGWPVKQLGSSPYIPAGTQPLEIKSRDLGLDLATGAAVYLAPPVAGFVGGDHVAMILAGRIHEAERVTLGLDIGTNTEVVLSCRGKLYSCSCASGPAFEGAHIFQGVRAIHGAVSEIRLDEHNVHYETIGNKPAIGLCGSGVVDAVAELLNQGIINPFGVLDIRHPAVRANGGPRGPEFLLIPVNETGAGQDLVLTQSDISAIQLAKAAVSAGVTLLLSSAGVDLDEIQEVQVAGAFGTHLRLDSAVTVGVLPPLPLDRFKQVGNAAGTGARMVLASASERRQAEAIAKNIHYVELAAKPEFGMEYSRAVKFNA